MKLDSSKIHKNPKCQQKIWYLYKIWYLFKIYSGQLTIFTFHPEIRRNFIKNGQSITKVACSYQKRRQYIID